MAETIDSLLVSLSLETDANSFKKASSAIKDVTDGMLQLAAVAGVKVDFNALTAGVAKSWSELKRLSDLTGFTVNQIRGLELAMRRIGSADPVASGQKLAQAVPELARKARNGEFDASSYKGTTFNPEQFARLESTDRVAATGYLLNSWQSMNQQQRQQFRPAVGWQENDDIARLAERGDGFFQQSMKMSSDYDQPFDPELNKNVQEFNDEMAKLSRNFENLTFALGGNLLPAVNKVLEAVNGFIKNNPETSQAILGVGTAAATGGAISRLFGPLFGAMESGVGAVSGLLVNPLTIGTASALTPGNLFYSADDIREMSDPRFYWQRRHPGETPTETPVAAAVPVLKTPGVSRNSATKASQDSLKSSANIAAVENALGSLNARTYLDALARAEGTAKYPNQGYNTMFGGSQFSNMSDHPRKLHPFTQTDGTTNYSSAAGRYQFKASTWDDAVKALGLNDFSPQSQDLAALWLIQQKGQLENVVNGNFQDATKGLGGVWASLPSSKYLQPKRSNEEMSAFYGYQSTQPDPVAYTPFSAQVPANFTQNVDLNISGVGMSEQQIEETVQRALTDAARVLSDSYETGGW